MSKSAKPTRMAKSAQPSFASDVESSSAEGPSASSPAVTEKTVEPVLKPMPVSQSAPAKPDLFDNPVYSAYVSETVRDAAQAYRIARLFSFMLFGAGIVLLVVSLFFGVFTVDTTPSILFGILGTVILVALLWYRPIERIQAGTEGLLRAQFAALAFSAQCEIALRALKSKDPESQSRAAQALQDATAQFAAHLESGIRMTSAFAPGASLKQK